MNMNNMEQILPPATAFNHSIDGKRIQLFHLKKGDIEAAVTNYGAKLVSLAAPDKEGNRLDVNIGFSDLDQYFNVKDAYYGATVGRYANRIAFGKFSLNGKEYTLATNNGPNHLHGGIKGFDDVVWDAEQKDEATVVFNYLSKDGEEGYPGNLQIKVTYHLTDQNELQLHFEAETDQTTIINLTNHAYFNLNGQGSGTILNHLLQINADHYTPIDETSIPFGTIESVEGTPFDFRQPTVIGARINNEHEQLKNGSGYDHNFALNQENGGLTFAAAAIGDKSGIKLEVFTTEPGIQLYTGNFMPGKNKFPNGATDDKRTAFCLETQHFPDSPNKPNFPTTTLNPGEKFDSQTIFRLTVA
ncbi:galactose mutarotase [Chitinophagaceae bacterium LB-8]|uniref:Aldose 1-epimerase n=1 Tax=Paraflavisolibacter caeni TaxID=2982496 RepID=A0A9X2XSJ2_9BACT|nr:galactose mutarotase [Paraflavisolibacter caeni]MCU7547920.1 galactose mutarotase [Paraflavisolibacter caeni]